MKLQTIFQRCVQIRWWETCDPNYLNRNISKKAAKVKKELFAPKESFLKLKMKYIEEIIKDDSDIELTTLQRMFDKNSHLAEDKEEIISLK